MLVPSGVAAKLGPASSMNRFLFLFLWVFVTAGLAASPVKPDERVLLFPTIGWQTDLGWELDVHGLVFESHAHAILTPLLRKAFGLQSEELDASGKALFAERANYFMVDNERHKRVSIQIGSKKETLSPTGANGHFHAHFAFSAAEWLQAGLPALLTNGLVEIETVSANPLVHPIRGDIYFVEKQGLSVISDIDDTIKVTDVTDQHAMLCNT
ncbi:MAG TPA: hypothetical protein VGE41_04700, partial [Verrucomicrobiae bacterium]